MAQESTVQIRTEPIMNYVLAVVTPFTNGNEEVTIKARGRSMSRAVDLAEMLRRRLVQQASMLNIKIDSEALRGENGLTANVSSVGISVKR